MIHPKPYKVPSFTLKTTETEVFLVMNQTKFEKFKSKDVLLSIGEVDPIVIPNWTDTRICFTYESLEELVRNNQLPRSMEEVVNYDEAIVIQRMLGIIAKYWFDTNAPEKAEVLDTIKLLSDAEISEHMRLFLGNNWSAKHFLMTLVIQARK